MKSARQLHVYLGVFFAPLLIYFALSGAWQVFRWNDLPREGGTTASRQVLHALSAPHTHATFPGADTQSAQSLLFKVFELLMCAGFVVTAILGVQMALQTRRSRRWMLITLIAGAVAPILFLLI